MDVPHFLRAFSFYMPRTTSLLFTLFRIKAQIDVINNRISNCLKVSSELKLLMVNPQLRPTKKLLVANQVLLETIKNQIIQDEKYNVR